MDEFSYDLSLRIFAAMIVCIISPLVPGNSNRPALQSMSDASTEIPVTANTASLADWDDLAKANEHNTPYVNAERCR